MSYALNVASDASRILSELSFDVQEDVWDLLEEIAADPRSPGASAGVTGNLHSYYRRAAGGGRLLVEFVVIIDDAARLVFVPRLAYGAS